MGKNKGYAFEKEVEDLLLEVGGQSRGEWMAKRSHRQPGSGNKEYAQGDVVTRFHWLEPIGQFMVECKDRKNAKGDGKSVSIKKEELDKARVEAENARHLPVFAFKVKQPVGGNRVPLFKGDELNPMNTKWFAMPFGAFRQLLIFTRDLYLENEELKRQLGESADAGSSSVYGGSDKVCRDCRRALDKAFDQVRRTMGG